VYKISYKTYLNDRLKEVDFHGRLTHPLYVQVTHERKTIFFKSYYFELFSKPRYLLMVPPLPPKGPTMDEVIASENEVIDFIIERHKDDFSLDIFKKEYAYYSKDLCDINEKGFMGYLYTFFWDEGMPFIGELIKSGGKDIVAYDLLRDFKKSMNKDLYDKLVANSFHYSPPYLPLYGFMMQTKRWPMLILTVMELERPENIRGFMEFVMTYYPNMPAGQLLEQVACWEKYV
jgi:hypothetical protein